jgi:mannose-6-phosphate isomerase-like protein (cupin superfamily)
MDKVNLAREFAKISEYWSPVVAAELNGQEVRLAKFKGEYDWHRHANEDELFLVVRGSVRLDLEDRSIELAEGEFFVVPKGVQHRPVASGEADVMLFEPRTTIRTGD